MRIDEISLGQKVQIFCNGQTGIVSEIVNHRGGLKIVMVKIDENNTYEAHAMELTAI